MPPFPARRCVWVLFAGLAGCEAGPPAVSTPATPTVSPGVPPAQPGRLPADKPDVLRLGYDPSARVLTVYDLPGRGGRWLLVTPDHPAGTPVGESVTFPTDPDQDKVSVFYTVPDRRPSPRVTLREIAEAQALHAAR